jgi:hypothetical protein
VLEKWGEKINGNVQTEPLADPRAQRALSQTPVCLVIWLHGASRRGFLWDDLAGGHAGDGLLLGIATCEDGFDDLISKLHGVAAQD